MESVLIIDDDQDTVETLKLLMEAEGIPAVAATSLKQGLETVKKTTHRMVVVMDYKFPDDMPPEYFVRQVRIIRDDVPIILISGLPKVFEYAAAMGVDAAIMKPCDLEEFVRVVSSHLY